MLRLNFHNQSARLVRARAREMGVVKAEWIHDAKDLLEASGETVEAGSESGPEGGHFERLRDMILMEESVEGEDEAVAESGGVGQLVGNYFLGLLYTDSNDSTTEANQQSLEHDVGMDEELAWQEIGQRSLHGVSVDDNQESRQPSTRARKIWEWSRYDADAEHKFYIWTEVMAEAPRDMLTPPREIESAWEWTRYDSEAEREEFWRASTSGRGDDGNEQASS